jgi:hypothetical protein
VGPGFFPLDEELGLVPGMLTPRLQEGLVRLGTWLPFAPAARLLGHFTGVRVSAATARRQTERAGAALVALQDVEVARLERETPAPPAGPAVQQLSVDGAMVPLVGGAWGEVKLLAIGTVQPSASGPRAVALSYFGRRANHATFARAALVETHRRGTETAGVVVGITDGAPWCQEFLDYHRPDAVRILDFAHASGYLQAAATAVFGAGSDAAETWLAAQTHELKHGAAAQVVAALAALPTTTAADPTAARAAQARAVGYLEPRQEQTRYAAFLAAGYPIGSGVVESANKLVTEARLKGAGMHWAPASVDPMVALRTMECADRWGEVWPRLGPALRARPQATRLASDPAPAPAVPAALPGNVSPPAPPASAPVAAPKTIIAGRPTAAHPWKRSPCRPGGVAHHAASPEL